MVLGGLAGVYSIITRMYQFNKIMQALWEIIYFLKLWVLDVLFWYIEMWK